MRISQIFQILALSVMLALSQTAEAQCVGVNIQQKWDCESGTASATANPNGGTAPYTYLWSTGANTQTVTGLTPGTYNIIVTDSVGCLEVKACVIINPLCCLWVNWDSTPDDCKPGGSGTLTIFEIGGGLPPYTVGLPNGMTKVVYSINWQNPIVVNGLESGNHILNITDKLGCSLEQWVFVPTASGPKVQINLPVIPCGQSSTIATAQVQGGLPPLQFLWSNGANTSSTTLGAGTHSVTVTDKNGCSDVASVNVVLPQPPAVSLVPTHTTCNLENGQIQTTVTGGVGPFTFNWSNGATTQNLTGLKEGAYNVTVTGTNGCVFIGGTTILPSVGASDTTMLVVACHDTTFYGIHFTTTKDTSFLEKVGDCYRTVEICAVILEQGATVIQNIFSCTPIKIGTQVYSSNGIVVVPGTGVCAGQVEFHLTFAAPVDTVQLDSVRICGFESASFESTTITTDPNTGCTNAILIQQYKVQEVQKFNFFVGSEEQCGLKFRVDTLQKGAVVFDKNGCTLTQQYGLLITNPLDLDTVANPTLVTGCGNFSQVKVDSISTDDEECTQTIYQKLVKQKPWDVDTIMGLPEGFCGKEAKSFLAFNGETEDTSNCKKTLHLFPVIVSANQLDTIVVDTVKFCSDSAGVFLSFKNYTYDEDSCSGKFYFDIFAVSAYSKEMVPSDTVEVCGLEAGVKTRIDSVVIDDCLRTDFFHVEVTNPVVVSTEEASFCHGKTFTWTRNGKVYDKSGVYSDTTYVNNCPDVKTLFLTQLPMVNGNIEEQTVCSKELPFYWNGQQLSASGVLTDTLNGGCGDSLAIFVLHVNQPSESDFVVEVCHDKYFQYEGNNLGEGVHEFMYTNYLGCDSTVIVTVEELPAPANIVTPPNVTVNLATKMSPGALDSLVNDLALGDSVTVLGASVFETLTKVSDSTWVQFWLVVTPCDTFNRSRIITFLQPLAPVNPPSDTCHIWVLKNPVAEDPIIVIEGIGGNVQLSLEDGTGKVLWEQEVGPLGFQHTEISVNKALSPGLYWITGRGPEVGKKGRTTKPLVVAQ